MERSFFRQVKEAIAGNAQVTLEGLGVNFKHGLKGQWSQCLCPFCGDKSGSASITQEGFLKCHQCGRKQDLFEWHAELHGGSAWEACKSIGESVGINFEFKRPRGRAPKCMTHELLRSSVAQLWEDEAAKPARDFLEARKIADPQILERFGVGFMSGYVTFAQFTPAGHLRPCYRTYTPGTKAWMWRGGSAGNTVGFWPYVNVPKDAIIWIMEGEWDVLTAWVRMRLQDQGIYCFCWTGGGNSPIPASAIPDAWHKKEVHILYDNDIFQSRILEEQKAPTPRDKEAMEKRWQILMDKIAPSFLIHNCKVHLRAIPIDPLKIWGADFRDWVDGGGRDLSDLTPHVFKDLRPSAKAPIKTDFFSVHKLAGEKVTFKARMGFIDHDVLTVPDVIELKCEMNQIPCCQKCRAPARFSSKLIYRSDYAPELAKSITSRDWEKSVLTMLVGKPASCVDAQVTPYKDRYVAGTKWYAMSEDAKGAIDSAIPVISEEIPSMSGLIEVTGSVYHTGKSVTVFADRLKMLDRAEVDLTPLMHDLKTLCPWDSNDPKQIRDYLRERYLDLSANVTRIYGRDDVHLAHDLVAHSAHRMTVDGSLTRGWIDAIIMSGTSMGKTTTFRRLMEHSGLGVLQDAGENISRAGLTLGCAMKDGTYRLQPGLFPRNDRKMLVLDEFQLTADQGLINCLQGARSEGMVSAAKIGESRSVPAAVRFCAMANWPEGQRRRFRFACEHFMRLYQSEQALRRADFAMIVPDEPTESELARDVEHCWKKHLARALQLRAWSMDETMIHFSKDALELAVQQARDWRGVYDPGLPLYTPEEKHLSILRIATAVANLCFSHPPDEPYHVRVREAHVDFAIGWLEKMFAESEYDKYSASRLRADTIDRPLEAEAWLSVGLNLRQPHDALTILSSMHDVMNRSKLMEICGKDHTDTSHWMGKGFKLGIIVHTKDHRSPNRDAISLTPAGDRLVRNMSRCADDYPSEWEMRYMTLQARSMSGPGLTAGETDLTPMTKDTQELIDEWEDRHGQADRF